MESIYDIWEFPVGFRISMRRHRVRPSDSIRKASGTALRCRCQTECFAVWMIAQIKLWACIVLQGSEPPARCLLVAGSAWEKERPVLAQRRKRHSSAIKQDYPGHPMVRLLGTRTKWKLSYAISYIHIKPSTCKACLTSWNRILYQILARPSVS